MKDICLIAIKVRRSDGTFYTLPTVKGGPGDNGKSAYQVALDNGFIGTEAEWLESLKQGPAGAAGNSLQFIYYRTTDSAHPETPISVNIDNSIPESWTAVPMGVTEMYKYEWVSLRTRVNGTWGVYSLPALWAIYGFGSTLPEIEIDDITGLSSILNELTDNQQHFIPKSYLFNPLHTKVASLNEFNLLNPSMFSIATSTALGAIKVGSTLKINAETGVLNTDISFEDLTDSALAEGKVDGAAVVWDETLGKYKNTLLSITGLFHPLYGKDNLNLRADILRSKTLIIPKTPATPDANEVALHAIENGYSILDPEAFTGAQYLDDLNDVALAPLTLTDGDSLFKDGLNFVNKPAYTKDQITTLFNGLSRVYHPLGGSYLLDFLARDLRSRTLFIPTEDSSTGQVGVSIFAQENGYSIANPGEAITEFGELHDIVALAWLNGQALLYRDGIFGNETIYNKLEVDALLAALNLGNYYTKQQALQTFHPKFGISGGVPLDLTADRLKSNTLLVPKTPPILENTEVGLHAQENGYTITEPGGGSSIAVLNDLDDVTILNPTNNHSLFFDQTLGVFFNALSTFDKINGTLDPARILTNAANRFVSDMQIIDWNSRESTLNKNVAGGYLGLNASAKIDFIYFPDVILGQVKYGGTFNINGIISSPYVALNGQDINLITVTDFTGYFFIAQADVTVSTIEAKTGDWIISNGAAGWAKVDNTDAVTSVAGRIGAVTLTKSDVGLSNVDNTADSLKNVLSATKLFTARTIWGQSFDGTSNISGSLTNVTDITGSGILNMGAILIPKTLYPTIPNNTVAVHAVENGYSIYDPEAGSVGSLDDLSDVDLIARVDKQLLYYNNVTGKFTNGIIDFSYISGNLGADKITQSDSYRFVTATEKSRFQTAYDWGNHALAGYLTTSVAASTYAAKSTTLSGYGISSTDTMFDGKYAALAGLSTQAFSTLSIGFASTQYDFANYIAHQNISPMSLKLWDNYNGTNAPSPYGTLLDIYGQNGHTHSQLYFGYVDGLLTRSAFYGTNEWGSWKTLLHSGNFTSYADSAGAASTVQGNLNTHINNNGTSVHGLGSASVKSDTDFIQNQQSSAQAANLWISGNAHFGGTYYNSFRFYNNYSGGNAGFDVYNSSGVLTFSHNSNGGHTITLGNFTALGGNSTQWNTAFSYSQIGHLPLSGGTIIGNTYIGASDNTSWLPLIFRRSGVTGFVGVGGTALQLGLDNGYLDIAPSNLTFVENGTTSRTVIHSGNIGSQSVNYAASAGNADTLDNQHASYFATASQLNAANLTNGYLPYWNGSSLVNSSIYQYGTAVGIGTITPSAGIHIQQNRGAGDYVAYIQNTGAGCGLKIYNADWDASDYLIYASNGGGYSFTVQGNGSVGIGYTDRSEKLAVNGSGYFNAGVSARPTTALDGFRIISDGTDVWQPAFSFYHSTAGLYGYMGYQYASDSFIYVNKSTWTGAGADFRWFTNNDTTTAKMTLFRVGGLELSSYLKATSIKIGNSWEAIPNGSNGLDLKYAGVLKATLSSAGDILAVGGVTCFAT